MVKTRGTFLCRGVPGPGVRARPQAAAPSGRTGSRSQHGLRLLACSRSPPEAVTELDLLGGCPGRGDPGAGACGMPWGGWRAWEAGRAGGPAAGCLQG